MPNLASIYTRSTKILDEIIPEEIKNSENNAAERQLLNNWKNSKVTQEKVKELETEIVKLMEECLRFAMRGDNTPKILINLIKINTLKEILQSYAI